MSNPRVDLHLHTTASDGCWSPGELVEQVLRAGVGCFAVADHDSVGSVPQAAALARERGLGFLPAAEVSSKLNGQLVHILAYGIDLSIESFHRFLNSNDAILQGQDDSSIRMLIDADYPIDYAEYQAYSWDQGRGGWKALNYLIDKGFCRDVRGFFEELFVDDLQLSLPEFPPPDQVVRHVQQAGGVPIWAHPEQSLRGAAWQEGDRMMAEMVGAGIEGVECFSHYHDTAWTRRCQQWASDYDLLITGGSDCHGGFVGRQVGYPEVYLDDLRLGTLAERLSPVLNATSAAS